MTADEDGGDIAEPDADAGDSSAPSMRKRRIGRWLCFVCVLAGGYFFLGGELVLVGPCYLLAGILTLCFGLPFAVLFMLVGLLPIAVASRNLVFLWAVAAAIITVCLVDLVEMRRLMKEEGAAVRGIAGGDRFRLLMSKRDVTYKLLRWLKRVVCRKPPDSQAD